MGLKALIDFNTPTASPTCCGSCVTQFCPGESFYPNRIGALDEQLAALQDPLLLKDLRLIILAYYGVDEVVQALFNEGTSDFLKLPEVLLSCLSLIAPYVRHISLSRLSVTNDNIEKISTMFCNIIALDLSYCDQLTIDLLRRDSPFLLLRNLKYLDMGFCENIILRDFPVSMSDALPKFQNLKSFRCSYSVSKPIADFSPILHEEEYNLFLERFAKICPDLEISIAESEVY